MMPRSDKGPETMVKVDTMPRSLAMTMLVGVALGGAFWGSLAAVLVH